MTPDDTMLMAYVDGELDAVTAARVERAVAADPALARSVAANRALRDRLAAGFGPIADAPVPERLTALLTSTVVPLVPRARAARHRWIGAGAAIAACLVVGVTIGHQRLSGPAIPSPGNAVASGPLARALDTQLAAASGDTRILVSFRDRSGAYCRVFAAPSADGIACRDGDAWAVRRTGAPRAAEQSGYRQAGTADAALMAAAQDMMAGEPLDLSAERRARKAGWR